MATFTENLEIYMQHFSVPVLLPGRAVSVSAFEDFEDGEMLGADRRGSVMGRARNILIRTDAITTLDEGDMITVNGVSREVMRARAIGDGKFSVVDLK